MQHILQINKVLLTDIPILDCDVFSLNVSKMISCKEKYQDIKFEEKFVLNGRDIGLPNLDKILQIQYCESGLQLIATDTDLIIALISQDDFARATVIDKTIPIDLDIANDTIAILLQNYLNFDFLSDDNLFKNTELMFMLRIIQGV